MTYEAAAKLFEQAKAIWFSGGWGMVALACNGLVIFGVGMAVLFRLFEGGALASPNRAFERWRRAGKGVGPLGRIVEEAMRCGSVERMERFFDAFRSDELAPFERDLRVLRVGVSTAPLLGLLGTVTGMLATFAALSSGSGGEKTMGLIAGGISEALITTETGLVLGLAGMMMQFALARQQDNVIRKYARLETLCLEARRDEPSNGGTAA